MICLNELYTVLKSPYSHIHIKGCKVNIDGLYVEIIGDAKDGTEAIIVGEQRPFTAPDTACPISADLNSQLANTQRELVETKELKNKYKTLCDDRQNVIAANLKRQNALKAIYDIALESKVY